MYSSIKAGKVLRALPNITDEQNHLRLFFNMYHDLEAEYPEYFTPELKAQLRLILKEAADLEIQWGKHIVSGGVLGLSDEVVEGYVKHLADYFAQGLGLELVYGESEPTPNPCAWVNDRMKEFGIDTNFFEDKEDSYDIGVEW